MDLFGKENIEYMNTPVNSPYPPPNKRMFSVYNKKAKK